MSCMCSGLLHWCSTPFSAVVSIQKRFVDDVSEKMKERREQSNRREREMRERAIRLHLDSLEEKYLCCVCGRSGEAREDDNIVYDTYSTIRLPSRGVVETAARRETALVRAELEAKQRKVGERNNFDARPFTRGSRTSSLAGSSVRSGRVASREVSGYYDSSDDDNDGVGSAVAAKQASERAQRRRHGGSRKNTSGAPVTTSREATEAADEDAKGDDDDAGGAKRTASMLQSRVSSTTCASIGNSARSLSLTQAPKGREGFARGDNGIGEDADAKEAAVTAEVSALIDPNRVPPLEIKHMMYKIHHAMLNKEEKTRRKHVAVHKDRGLMMIEESEIDTFQQFFQRPVHGYLCVECYRSAQRRMDALAQQIHAVLFRAEHPLLRKVTEAEVTTAVMAAVSSVRLGTSTGGATTTMGGAGGNGEGIALRLPLVQSVLSAHAVRDARRAVSHGGGERLAGADGTSSLDKVGNGASSCVPAGGGESLADEAAANITVGDGDANRQRGTDPATAGCSPSSTNTTATATLEDGVIFGLRAHVKCGVCQRRQSCFFERDSVLFLCQFCCARDRHYRDNAICINDEPMHTDCAHLLYDLSRYYARVHVQQELRQLPQTEVHTAETDFFGPVQEANLFQVQVVDPELLPVTVQPLYVPPSSSTIAPEGDAALSPAALQAETRVVVGQSMVSLFGDTSVRPAGAAVDLFKASDAGAGATTTSADAFPRNSNSRVQGMSVNPVPSRTTHIDPSANGELDTLFS